MNKKPLDKAIGKHRANLWEADFTGRNAHATMSCAGAARTIRACVILPNWHKLVLGVPAVADYESRFAGKLQFPNGLGRQFGRCRPRIAPIY
jgi:hypothetical protein